MPGDGVPDFGGRYWRTAPAAAETLADLAAATVDDAAFRMLADAIPTLCWIANGDGYIVWYNRRWHEYCGTTAADMEGWGWTAVHDPATLPGVMARWTAAIASAEPFEMTFPLRGADGRFRPFLTRIQPVRDATGRVVRWFGVNTDVSGQVEAEADLRHTVEFSPLVMWTALPDGTLDSMGERWRDWTGTDALGTGWAVAMHPDDLVDASRQWEATLAAGTPHDSRFRLRMRDGRFRWMHSRAYPRRDAAGATIKWYGCIEDVQDAKEAQAALVANEARFRGITESIDHMVWSTLPDGFHDYYNQRWYDFTGVPPGSTDGEGWNGLFHPDDQDRAWAAWRHSLATGAPYHIEYRLRHHTGQYRWVLGRAQPVRDGTGAIVRWYGTCTDIQDIVEAREVLAWSRAELETLVRERTAERDRTWATAQDLLTVVDAGGVIRAANPAWTAVLGWLPDEVVGRSHDWFSEPGDQAVSQATLQAALAGHLRPYENRVRCKGGGHRVVSWVATAEAGVVYASGRDVTAEREAAEALQAAEASLRQSQKMEAVGQLTGGIAHDFNNMLAVVMGSLDLLGRRLGEGDARARRYVDMAMEGARRAAALTMRLLAFSRQQPLQPVSIDANKLVAGMSDLLRGSLGADIRLETVLAGGLWRTHADPNGLENVVLNLAVNARDAMPAGGRLTVETANAFLDERYAAEHLGVPAGQYVLVAVTDTGCGMPGDVVARAFDPFFTTKEVGRGTGLGLSQVYGFVKQSGGHVKIYSEPGQGTTVKVYLPRQVGEAPDGPARGGAAGDLPQGEAHEVVLVVEDEPGVRQVSTDALAGLGYRVLQADGGEAALRLLDAHPEVSVLFTDVVMPGMNGRVLADEARRRRPGLRVLFTTGYTRNAVVHNGVLDPGVQLIGKPFTVAALASKLREVLDA